MKDFMPAAGRPAALRSSRILALGGLVAALLGAAPALAEIYKFRDDQGQWHFSDKPFEDQPRAESGREGLVATPDSEASAARDSSPAGEDVAGRLSERFQPATPIEEVTLAVVSIESAMGVGSGFFISDDGLLLTNRHVVRPTESSAWEETHGELEAEKQALKELRSWLEREEKRLGKMKTDLLAYEEAIRQAGRGNIRGAAHADYEILSERYWKWKREFDESDADYQARQRTHRKAQSDFDFKSSMARMSRRFTVVLKDDTKFKAQLVTLGKTHDLALLKVDGVHTPRLAAAEGASLPQGLPVYAIGSPLGMRDYVTSGIVTRVRGDAIVTDTQILPGNSGGPLVDEAGRVLGINTQKVLNRAISGEGFGIAIPLQTIRDEFGERLRGF